VLTEPIPFGLRAISCKTSGILSDLADSKKSVRPHHYLYCDLPLCSLQRCFSRVHQKGPVAYRLGGMSIEMSFWGFEWIGREF
jgi:hypothetical protein